MNNLLTKQQAAEYLGVTIRSVEGYAAKGKLTPHKAKGARGDIAVYSLEELDKLKAEREQVKFIKHFSPLAGAIQRIPAQSIAPPQPELSGFIAHLAADPQIRAGLQELLIEAIKIAAQEAIKSYFQLSTEDRLALTLKQASHVANVSVSTLRIDIHSGLLKAKIVGRGWKIRRRDLEAYVDKVWQKK